MRAVLRKKGAVLGALLAAAAFAAPAAWASTPATTATDVCPANANPCNVTTTFDVTDNAVLDFGTRSVNVSGAGAFNFGSGSGRIECGAFTASSSGSFLDAAGPGPVSGTLSGSVVLLARRQCTSASPVVPCVDINDCELGPCGVRRCSGKSTKTCLTDANCQLGTCSAFKRCTGSVTIVRCSTNADCDFGTCPAQLTCTGRGDNPVSCSSNSDCSFGTCTVGTASITLDSGIAGSSDFPATVLVRAADSVSISKPVNLNSTSIDSDGGSFTVDAAAGSITITNNINATGGSASQGGTLEFNAGTDIVISDDISVIGGDFDGGSIDLTSGRDTTIGSSLLANSVVGAGFGGDITITAGRDFSFSGVSASNKSTMEASGHTDISNFAGDGGTLDLSATHNLTLGANTRLIGTGAIPDASGADVFLESGAALAMSGDLTAKALGVQGSGGYVQAAADLGAANVSSSATFDVTGGSAGGGSLEIDAYAGDLTFSGDSDVSGGGGGSGGSALLSARGTANVAGTLFVNGAGGGSLTVDACRLTLAAGGTLDNTGTGGGNSLVTHDTMKLAAGSTMTADPSGTNTLRYRTAAKPPVVQGTVTPAPAIVLDPSLAECPLCGNGMLDPGETCDDGNAVDGDGCSSQCQNEKCLAQTISPGYPAVALCEDGNVCTDDVCNTALNGGTCQHPAKNCDDSVSCTVDSCNPADGTCQHAASDSLCNDNNACTDDFCSLTTGCSNTANSNPCSDGNICTTNDTCVNKVCKGTRIQGCLFCGDGLINPFAGEECDDGNNDNGDCCSSTCHYEAAGSACEDGQFCTVNDTCNGTGTCLSGTPNPCTDTDACTADSCDEAMGVCVHAQTPRDPATCMAAPKSKLQIVDSAKVVKDKLSWQWGKGDAFLQSDLGTPDVSTPYTLCVYDESGSVSSLKASIDIAPSATLWTSKDPKGFQYKDLDGTSDGVTRAQLKPGPAGKTKVKVGAGGVNLALPAPAGVTFFHQDPDVVVQLVGGAGNQCWTSQFAAGVTKSNAPGLFQARNR